MEKLLISGINTRAMVNSGLKLNYDIFSTSYFSTYDFKKLNNEKHLLNEEKGKSCGFIENNYTSMKLLEISLEYLEEVDYIIPVSGLSPDDFEGKFKKFRKKIIGNKKIKNIDNKFNLYKKIKNKFLTPETFKLKDIDETVEIIKNSESKQYIIKPLKGFGGYDINYLNNDSINSLNMIENEWIIQEYINGENISSSVLGSCNDSKTILNSRNLNENDYDKGKGFIYTGNLMPLDNNTLKRDSVNEIINTMNDLSQDIIKNFNLIGSNGVDYILDKENELNIIEINPRFQGTYECCEDLLNINMLDAHIKACENELIDIENFKKNYLIKKIIYSENKVQIKNFNNMENIYDIPYPGVIIEKNQPIATLIEKNSNIEKLCENLKLDLNDFRKNLLNIK